MDYKEENHSFYILDEDDNLISCPYLFMDKDTAGALLDINKRDNFIIKILHKKDVPENEILNIFTKQEDCNGQLIDKRIGWIIPFSSLISIEHDYVNNIHFGYYAFYAYANLINNSEVIMSLKQGKSFNAIINQLYIENKDCVMFIVEKDNIPTLQSLECYEISMYQHGYYRDYYRVNPHHIHPKSPNEVYLKKTSEIFYSENKYQEDYIKSFIHYWYFESNPKIRFFLLYQMIEILMDDIMINQLQKQLNDYKLGKAATRGLDSLIKANTELSRIKKMIELSQLKISDYENLHKECDNYLVNKGHDTVAFPESLYHFRNLIVHRFRWIISDEETVNKINDLMEIFLFDVIINYKREF